MTVTRPTSTAVHLTPAQMQRLEAAGWRPGTVALGEWLTQRAEASADGLTDEHRARLIELLGWGRDDG